MSGIWSILIFVLLLIVTIAYIVKVSNKSSRVNFKGKVIPRLFSAVALCFLVAGLFVPFAVAHSLGRTLTEALIPDIWEWVHAIGQIYTMRPDTLLFIAVGPFLLILINLITLFANRLHVVSASAQLMYFAISFLALYNLVTENDFHVFFDFSMGYGCYCFLLAAILNMIAAVTTTTKSTHNELLSNYRENTGSRS
jgi:hypothetical protein